MNTRLLAAGSLLLLLGTSAPVFAGDQTPVPAKDAVQISVTDVDAPDGQSLPSFAGVRGQLGPHNDLSTLKEAAAKDGLAIAITPRFTITTFDGTAGIVSEQIQIPYMTLDGSANATENAVHYATVTSSLSATPHVNLDGTISVEFTLVESKVNGPSWRELGPPNIVSATVTTKLTFRDGDTLAVVLPPTEGSEPHRAFLTVKLVPAKKG